MRVCGTFLVVFGVGGPQGIGIRAGASAVQAAARASTVADCWSSSSSSFHPTDFLRTVAAVSSAAAVGLLQRRRQGLMIVVVVVIVVHRNVGGYCWRCRSLWCLCRPCCHRSRRPPHAAGDAALVEALLRPDGGCFSTSSSSRSTSLSATIYTLTVIVIHAQAQADAVAAEGDAALAVPPISRHPHSGDLGITFADHPLGYPILIPPVLYSLVFIAVQLVFYVWYWHEINEIDR